VLHALQAAHVLSWRHAHACARALRTRCAQGVAVAAVCGGHFTPQPHNAPPPNNATARPPTYSIMSRLRLPTSSSITVTCRGKGRVREGLLSPVSPQKAKANEL
jgi:hypothetical protein